MGNDFGARMEWVQLPLDIRTVEIWADNDLSGVGQRAAEKQRKVSEEGRRSIFSYRLWKTVTGDMLNKSAEYLQATKKWLLAETINRRKCSSFG